MDIKRCRSGSVHLSGSAMYYIHGTIRISTSIRTLLYMIFLIIFIISYLIFGFTLFSDCPPDLHSFGFILVIPLLVYFSRKPLARPWDSALHVGPTCPLAILKYVQNVQLCQIWSSVLVVFQLSVCPSFTCCCSELSSSSCSSFDVHGGSSSPTLCYNGSGSSDCSARFSSCSFSVCVSFGPTTGCSSSLIFSCSGWLSPTQTPPTMSEFPWSAAEPSR